MNVWTILITVSLALAHTPLTGQTVEWARQLAAAGEQTGNAAHADASGNGYVTGYFAGELDFGGTTLNGAGVGSIFLAKYAPDGSLDWVVQSITNGWEGGRAITTDADGNVYLTGRIDGESQIGGATLTAVGANDVIIAKFDAEGNLIWARTGGGPGLDWGNGIAVNDAGNVVVAGQFDGVATFGAETITSAGGASDAFVVVYDSEGTVQWARAAGGVGADNGYDVAIDAAGSVYMTGTYNESALFEGVQLQSAGASDGFVAKYNSAGALQWARSYGSTGADNAESIEVLPTGEALVAGSFTGTIAIGDLISLSSNGDVDIFIARLHTDGEALSALNIGGSGPDGSAFFGQSMALALHNDGSYWLTSTFAATMQVGDLAVTSRGDVDIFTAAFASDDIPQWVETCGGAGIDNFVGMGADADGNTFIVGNFFSNSLICGDHSFPYEGPQLSTFIARVAPPAEGAPQIVVSEDALDFGTLERGNSRTLTLALSAAGSTPLRVESIAIDDPAAADKGFALMTPLPGDLPVELVEEAELTVRIRFEALAIGAVQTELVIRSNDPVNPMLIIPIDGVGSAPVSVDERNVAFGGEDIVLAPNPAYDFTFVRLMHPATTPLKVSIRNYAGRLIEQREHLYSSGHEVKLDVSGLARGIYTVHIVSQTHYETLPLIIYR